MILSVPEGDDKPLKYPLMFSVCDVLLVNKTDVMGFFNFDIRSLEKRVRCLNPDMEIIPVSCTSGEGIDIWTEWVRREIRDFVKG